MGNRESEGEREVMEGDMVEDVSRTESEREVMEGDMVEDLSRTETEETGEYRGDEVKEKNTSLDPLPLPSTVEVGSRIVAEGEGMEVESRIVAEGEGMEVELGETVPDPTDDDGVADNCPCDTPPAGKQQRHQTPQNLTRKSIHGQGILATKT